MGTILFTMSLSNTYIRLSTTPGNLEFEITLELLEIPNFIDAPGKFNCQLKYGNAYANH